MSSCDKPVLDLIQESQDLLVKKTGFCGQSFDVAQDRELAKRLVEWAAE